MIVPDLNIRLNYETDPKAPANLEAEQAVLGALMFQNSALETLGDFLKPEHFAEPFHGRLFSEIQAVILKGGLAEPITLQSKFQGDQDYEELGGLKYLADLIDKAPPPVNAAEYARTIHETASRRMVAQVCQDGARAARTGSGAAFDVVSELRSALEEIEQDSAPEDASIIGAPAAASHAINQMQERSVHGRLRGKMTGLRCVDRRLGGLLPGALVVIGGRPSMGKTSLARNLLHGAAARNPDSLFLYLSIEMSPEEMTQRELSAVCREHGEGVEYQAMARAALTPLDFQTIEAARQHVPENLLLDDCPSLSLEDVRRKVWNLNRRGKLGGLVIDYLQIMRKPVSHGRNDAAVIGEITQGLKQIARQSKTCVLLVSQLSRALEGRDDKRPVMSDLRDSGSIEQDADAVLFPFREHYYITLSEPKKPSDRAAWEIRLEDTRRRLDVICGKQRQGPVGLDRQTYWAEYDFIEDWRE